MTWTEYKLSYPFYNYEDDAISLGSKICRVIDEYSDYLGVEDDDNEPKKKEHIRMLREMMDTSTYLLKQYKLIDCQ